MARTDAHAVEGFLSAVDRATAYVAAGADMIFAEALTTLDEYRKFTAAVRVPVLANLTEFGKTPLFTLDEMRDAGVRLALYPLTAFRMMSAAAERAYATLRRDGTQKSLIDTMQTRQQLYDALGYHDYEKKLDELFARDARENLNG
jgi:methylisocitrate lyase